MWNVARVGNAMTAEVNTEIKLGSFGQNQTKSK